MVRDLRRDISNMAKHYAVSTEGTIEDRTSEVASWLKWSNDMASEKQQYECSMGLKNSGAQGNGWSPFSWITNKQS